MSAINLFLMLLIVSSSIPYHASALSISSSELHIQKLEKIIEEQLELYKIPGLAIAIVQDDKAILVRGFGVKNIEKQFAVSEQTIFPIGSLSKQFTATLAGIRVDEGVLDWDDLIVDYLPDYRFRQNGNDLALTLRDTLAHRSGYARNDTLWSNPAVSRMQIIKSAPKASAMLYLSI